MLGIWCPGKEQEGDRTSGEKEDKESEGHTLKKRKQKVGFGLVKSHDNFVWELDMVLNLVD